MLSPKRVKHRKQHRGRRAGLSRGQTKVQFGEYGIKALEPGCVVALGGGTTIDDENWALVRSRAVTVYLEASFDTLWSRIGGERTRPLAAGRSRAHLAGLYESRRSRYQEADHTVDANRPLNAVAAEVLSLWSG